LLPVDGGAVFLCCVASGSPPDCNLPAWLVLVAPVTLPGVLCCTHSVELTGFGGGDENMAASLESTSSELEPTTSKVDQRAPDSGPVLTSSPSRVRQVVTWLSLIGGLALVGITYFPVLRAAIAQDPWLLELFQHHYAAIFGLPGAALLSFILVVVFEARFDNIEMEIMNVLKFRGASGPIVLWVLCFLSMTAAIRLLW